MTHLGASSNSYNCIGDKAKCDLECSEGLMDEQTLGQLL